MVLTPEFLAQLGQAAQKLEAQRSAQLRPLGSINPSTLALSHALLTNGAADFRKSFDAPKPPSHAGPSVISRILDVMSRPLYAVADAAYESEDASANGGSIWDSIKGLGTGVVHGLSGTQKRTWADVIQQGKDINAQKDATGKGRGYQLGQGGELSTGDKIGAVGLNILADPSLTFSPLKTVRAFGEGSELYNLPTIGSLSKKAFSRGGVAGEAENAAENEAGQAISPVVPRNTLLDISPKALANAKSIPDIVRSKIGEPVVVAASHPHINIDEPLLGEGRLRASSLTDEGRNTARSLHPELAKTHGVISSRDVAHHVANNALADVMPGVRDAIEHNRKWISEAVKNGIDPERALQVVKDVQAGADFKTAFEDAVRNSKPFKAAKAISSGEKKLKGLTNPSFKLSAILAPTAGEILDHEAANPGAIARAKALNSIKRAGALSRPLNKAEQAIHDDVAEMARNRIAGKGGFKPSGAYNDLTQTMVWNTVRGRLAPITAGGAANVRAINERTLRVVAHIEQTLENEGIRPVAADGTPARISDAVLNHSEFPEKLKNYPNHILNHYVNGTTAGAVAKAENAIDQADKVEPILQGSTLAVNQIFNDPALSDPVKFLAGQRSARGVENAIVMATGSTRAARAGKAIYQAVIANQRTATEESMRAAGKALSDIVSTGTIPNDYKAIVDSLGRAVSRSLSDGLDVVPAPTHLGTLIGPQARAETGFLGRMATWYGQHDLRPIVRARQATARTNAALWTHYWSDTFKNLSPEQRLEAIRIAQGVFIGTPNPIVKGAADKILMRFENLLSSTRIPENARGGNSVAMRAGITMGGKYGLNAELKRMGSSIQLTNKTVKDMLGKERDFSNGSDWLNSWEAHKFTGDPVRELARFESALFNVAGKKAIIDDIINRFGSAGANAERNVGIKDFEHLKGVYFTPEVAQQITRVIRDLYAPKPQTGPLLRSMDNILRMWKTGVTIYSPSHAIHNGIGDIYNNWIAGVNDVRNYSKAIQVMRAFHANYEGLEGLQPLLSSMQNLPEELSKLSPEVSGTRVIAQTRDGQKLTAAQLYMAAHNQGILQSVEHMEDIYSDVNGGLGGLSRVRPFGGRVSAAAHAWVQGMDHFTRLAQFIHEVRSGRGDLATIFDTAGKQVRKYHPDGMDLTDFERTTLRRAIPFYSWTRKAIPFSIESMLTKPGKFVVYPKVMAGFNPGNEQGINPGQQFPSDQLFPSWITDSGIGPIGGPGGFLNNVVGGPEGYVTANLSVPPIDLLQTYGNHPNEGVLSGLNPLVKDPIELMQGRRLDTGVPIDNPGQYIAESIPALGLASRLTNVTPLGVTPKGQQQGIGNQQNFINFLTGLKLTNTGQYIKQAQYERHEKENQLKKTNRENLKQFLNSLNGGK